MKDRKGILLGPALVAVFLVILVSQAFCRNSEYYPRSPRRTQYDTRLERERAANKEKAQKARQEAIRQATERMKAAAQCMREISEEIRKFQKEKGEALNEMIEEGSGIHTKPHYMEKPPKMYDHIPTSDEVYRDMAPSARFQYSKSNLNRLQKELETCKKEMEKAQEELKILQEE